MKAEWVVSGVAVAMLIGASAPSAAADDPLHGWIGATGDSLRTWTHARLDEAKRLEAAIIAVSGPRTIANTLVPYDQASNLLNIAGNQTGVLFAVGDDAALRDAAQALEQDVSSAQTEFSLNRGVYDALAALEKTEEVKTADPATRYYLSRHLLEYRLAGVDKDAAARARITALRDKITTDGLAFSRNVQDSVGKVPAKPDELAGLPQDFIDRHKPAADGVVTLTTDEPDYTPVMKFAENGALRRRMKLAYTNRAFPANEAVLRSVLVARASLAKELGFKTYADLAMADQMIGSPKALKAFLGKVDAISRAPAAREQAQLMALVKKEDPKAGPLTEADSSFWQERYRRAAYDFDSQSVRPYFPYAEVEAGILDIAARFFHVSFTKVTDAVVWDPNVTVFDLVDQTEGRVGTRLGRVYLDMHPREGKDKWFSAAPVTPGAAGLQLPEGMLICNFPGGTKDDPGLMEYGDVVTFFHEFGHLMHHILGSQGKWSDQGGFNIEGDFIEAPSQMLEEMFRNVSVLQSFAKHYQTGEPIPAALVAKMTRADAYARGSWVQRQLSYATYALDIHDRPPADLNLTQLYKIDQEKFSPFAPLAGGHTFASFTHLIGYASNYYTYVLDKVIAVDFFDQFDKGNLVDGPTALRYRRTVLEPGASKPAATLVKDFLGRDQSVDALKRWIEVQFQP